MLNMSSQYIHAPLWSNYTHKQDPLSKILMFFLQDIFSQIKLNVGNFIYFDPSFKLYFSHISFSLMLVLFILLQILIVRKIYRFKLANATYKQAYASFVMFLWLSKFEKEYFYLAVYARLNVVLYIHNCLYKPDSSTVLQLFLRARLKVRLIRCMAQKDIFKRENAVFQHSEFYFVLFIIYLALSKGKKSQCWYTYFSLLEVLKHVFLKLLQCLVCSMLNERVLKLLCSGFKLVSATCRQAYLVSCSIFGEKCLLIAIYACLGVVRCIRRFPYELLCYILSKDCSNSFENCLSYLNSLRPLQYDLSIDTYKLANIIVTLLLFSFTYLESFHWFCVILNVIYQQIYFRLLNFHEDTLMSVSLFVYACLIVYWLNLSTYFQLYLELGRIENLYRQAVMISYQSSCYITSTLESLLSNIWTVWGLVSYIRGLFYGFNLKQMFHLVMFILIQEITHSYYSLLDLNLFLFTSVYMLTERKEVLNNIILKLFYWTYRQAYAMVFSCCYVELNYISLFGKPLFLVIYTCLFMIYCIVLCFQNELSFKNFNFSFFNKISLSLSTSFQITMMFTNEQMRPYYNLIRVIVSLFLFFSSKELNIWYSILCALSICNNPDVLKAQILSY